MDHVDVADPHEVDPAAEQRPQVTRAIVRESVRQFLDKRIRHWKRIGQVKDHELRELASFYIVALQDVLELLEDKPA